jgi:hypothetical protein
MSAANDHVIHRLAVGDPAANAELVEWARTSDDVSTVVSAALFIGQGRNDVLTRAAGLASTTRDRQLVAIASAHLDGDAGRVEDLARDHLADHPDDVLVAWIASASNTRNRKDPT